MSRPVFGYLVKEATKLFTARRIGGVDFDGTKNIDLPGVNTEGNQDTTGNAATATLLAVARKIGGVAFDGSKDISLPGVNEIGNQSTTGNAASATKLQTARSINGTLFSGTANILTAVWGQERRITIGETTKLVDGSVNIAWTLAEIGIGSVGLLNTTGNTAQFLRGDGQWATVSTKDTQYTAGNGLTLSGTEFSLPVTLSGSGSFVSGVTQTANGLTVTLGTPPNTNTTYAEIPEAEVTAGTAATLRTITARRLKQAVDTHGLKIGTTATTAKAGNWKPTAADIPILNQNTTGSAARLTTARSIKVGNTTRSFDGTANIAWTIAEIGAVPPERTITAGKGLKGGGTLAANRTIDVDDGMIPSSAIALGERNLNDVQTPGFYYQPANANATSARNYPLEVGQAGTMVVTTAAGIIQEYTTYGPSNRKLIRGLYSGTWSQWRELYRRGISISVDDIPNIPISKISNLQTTLDGKVNVSGNQVIAGTKDFSGVLRATGTANATSATTGALRSSGGLGVASNIFAGGNVTGYSDIRKKKDIEPIRDALELILKSRGVYYTRKDTGSKEIGYIAQEMLEIIPRLVGGDPVSGLGIHYGNMTAVISEAVKTIFNEYVLPTRQEVGILTEQVELLKQQNEQLYQIVESLIDKDVK